MTEPTGAQQSLREYLEWLESAWDKPEMNMGGGLKKVGLPTVTREGLVLKYGTMFERQPLTPEERAKVDAVRRKVGARLRECFRVAWEVADTDSDFKYVEGWAQSIIPTHHAWNTLNGKVVDLTWRYTKSGKVSPHGQQFAAGTWREDIAYMGVEIPTYLVTQERVRTMRHQGFLDDIDGIKQVPDIAQVTDDARAGVIY